MFGTFKKIYYFCGVKKQNGIFDLNDFFSKTFLVKSLRMSQKMIIFAYTIKKNKDYE